MKYLGTYLWCEVQASVVKQVEEAAALISLQYQIEPISFQES